MAMTADESDEFWARMYRFRASTLRALAARDEMFAKVIEAGTAARKFAEAWVDSEAREVAEHPDLAELNVQLDGFYGDHR